MTTLGETKDIEKMRLDEFVGSLRTYEMNFRPPKIGKSITLKMISGDLQRTDTNDDGFYVDEEDTTLFVMKLKNSWRTEKKCLSRVEIKKKKKQKSQEWYEQWKVVDFKE